MIKRGAASLTITLFDEDGVFWERGYGYADVGKKTAAQPTTIYRVGSISKLFTATAIMQLAAKGLVDLDAPLTSYLPEFSLRPPPPFMPGADKWSLSDITIRTMLTHHSGIPTNVMKGYVTNEPIPFTEYVNTIRGWRAQAPVGLAFGYSNVAVTLLGHVVERMSGEPFADYIQKHILTPSGMETASFESTPAILAQVAHSYFGGEEIDAKQIGIVPAGGLFSNARDLAAFGRMALRGGLGSMGRVLETSDLESMWTRQNGNVALDRNFKMGLGWLLKDAQSIPGGGRAVWHNGGLIAHRSYLLLLPDDGIGVVALTNTAETLPDEIGQLALELALESRAGTTGDKAKFEDLPALVPPENIDHEKLDTISGNYSTLFGGLTLRRQGDSLRSQKLAFLSSVELQPLVDGSYRPRFRVFDLIPYTPEELSDPQLKVEFEHVGEFDTIYVGEKQEPSTLIGVRVSPSPAMTAWRNRVGRYRLINAGSDFPFYNMLQLHVLDGRLMISFHGDSGWPLPISPDYLEPVTDDEACGLPPWGSSCLYARMIDGELELELLGYKFRHDH